VPIGIGSLAGMMGLPDKGCIISANVKLIPDKSGGCSLTSAGWAVFDLRDSTVALRSVQFVHLTRLLLLQLNA